MANLLTRATRSLLVFLLGLPLTMNAAGAAGVIADSETDFSGVQGHKGWYYGYFTIPGDATTFTELIHFISDSSTTSVPHWRVSTFFQPFVYLFPYGGHPDNRSGSAVRRWLSPVEGDVLLTGYIEDADLGGGNGVTTTIYVDGAPIFSKVFSGADGVGVNYSLPLTVTAGTTIDFEIADNGDFTFDNAYFYSTISAVPLPASLPMILPAVVLLRRMHRRV